MKKLMQLARKKHRKSRSSTQLDADRPTTNGDAPTDDTATSTTSRYVLYASLYALWTRFKTIRRAVGLKTISIRSARQV